MVALAKAFAAAEPKTVIRYLDDEEESSGSAGISQASAGSTSTSGSSLRPTRPPASGRASSRRGSRSGGISRLRMLVSGAATDLNSAGQERKAKRLLRAREGSLDTGARLDPPAEQS